MSQSEALTPEAVTRIVEHMNDDHSDSVLLYVQAFGGLPQATKAYLKSVDAEGMDIEARIDDDTTSVRIPFDHPLTDAHDAHMTMIKMSKQARNKLRQ